MSDRVGEWFAEAERDCAATAFHEAGHVTAAVLLGLPVGKGRGATVSPQLGWFGSADIGCGLETTDVEPLFWASASGAAAPTRLRGRLEAYVLSLMLGPFAEARAIGEGLALGYGSRTRWRHPTTAADDVTRELAERESVLIHHAVAAAAQEAGIPAVLDDSERAWGLVQAACVTEAEACGYTGWLYERALTLLRQQRFWLPCCALAAALIEETTVSGRRCVRIVRAALKPTPDRPANARLGCSSLGPVGAPRETQAAPGGGCAPGRRSRAAVALPQWRRPRI